MLTLELCIAGVMLISLIIYMLTGGADFGGGVWDLFATGPRAKAQRSLITQAIAPIWEANHVWLIVIVVLLFVAFPVAIRGDEYSVTHSTNVNAYWDCAAWLGVYISYLR